MLTPINPTETTMNLQSLKTAYLSRHWLGLDESARAHLAAFVAMVEGAAESAAIAVEHLIGLGYTVTEPAPVEVEAPQAETDPAGDSETLPLFDATPDHAEPAADLAPSAPDSAPAHEVETVTYADGTTATGTPPLPAMSPAEQGAAAGDAKPAGEAQG